MKVIVRLFYSFLIVIAANCSLAQTYNFKIFTEDNGLPQSYIYNINQSENGFLNISTGDGYSIFDGLKFTNYTQKDGLAENNTTCSFIDNASTTWIGHFQNGISYIENNRCYKLKQSDTLNTKILCFAQGNTKQVFFGTQSKGLFYIDETKKIVAVPTPNNLTCINKIIITANNEFVIASNSGLFFYKNISNKLVLKHSFSQFADYDVKDICISEKNKQKLFVVTNNSGVAIIDLYKGEIKKITQEQLKLENLNFTSILEDFFGNLWIGTFGEGVVKIDYKDLLNFDFSNISKINLTNNLPSNYIQTIYQGYEGNIWQIGRAHV